MSDSDALRPTGAPHDTVYSHDDEDDTLFAPTTHGFMNGFAHIYESECVAYHDRLLHIIQNETVSITAQRRVT